MNKILEILKKGEIHLVLFQGLKETDKTPFHAFLVMNGLSFEKLKTHQGEISLSDYGDVIYSDEGFEVPDYISVAVMSGFKKRFLKEN